MSTIILNIDDNEAGRYATGRILARAGFRLAEAATAAEGIEMARSLQPDLILLDVNLPDMSGFEVCRYLKTDQETTSIPVMLMSASFVGSRDQIKGLEGGADGYLTEPLEPEVLLAHINAILRMRQAERKLDFALQEAEAANRAKDQFLAVLSHELRTPLNPILAAVTLLTDMDLPGESRPLIDIIHRNALLEARLIDDLLDVTRIAKGKLQMQFDVVNVHAVIQDVVEICSADIESKRLELDLRLNATATYVRADMARLQQVIWNLIKNAVKFTAAGGRIAISTMNSADGSIQISVVDNGIGIEPHLLTTIFDAFDQGAATTNRTFGGLGLGLAISRSIVNAHQGTLVAASAGLGHGSTFTVELKTHLN